MTRIQRPFMWVCVLNALLASGNRVWAQPATDQYGNGNPSGLEAGGLTPIGGGGQVPAAPAADPGTQTTDETLKAAEEKDSGRGLEFVWLNGEIGYQLVGLQSLKSSGLVDDRWIDNTQHGLAFGGGLGVRVIFLTLGGRFRYASLTDMSWWTAGLEAGLHLPMGRFEPYVIAGVGYASAAAKNTGGGLDFEGAGVGLSGLSARGGVGVDVYVTNVVSVGANLTGDALFLWRSGVSADDLARQGEAADATAAAIYEKDGSGIGAAMTATAVAGLHF